MNKFLYRSLLLLPMAFGFNILAESVENKTITMTDKTPKILNIRLKPSNKIITLEPGQPKKFYFKDVKGAEVRYQNSFAPYRPLELASLYLGLTKSSSNNVSVDLIPGTYWAAKIANPSYIAAPQNASFAFRSALS